MSVFPGELIEPILETTGAIVRVVRYLPLWPGPAIHVCGMIKGDVDARDEPAHDKVG
jgi:hypothetical protein